MSYHRRQRSWKSFSSVELRGIKFLSHSELTCSPADWKRQQLLAFYPLRPQINVLDTESLKAFHQDLAPATSSTRGSSAFNTHFRPAYIWRFWHYEQPEMKNVLHSCWQCSARVRWSFWIKCGGATLSLTFSQFRPFFCLPCRGGGGIENSREIIGRAVNAFQPLYVQHLAWYYRHKMSDHSRMKSYSMQPIKQYIRFFGRQFQHSMTSARFLCLCNSSPCQILRKT